MDVCAATVALMLSGSITLQLHNAPLSRSFYRDSAWHTLSPWDTPGVGALSTALTKVQVQTCYSISTDSNNLLTSYWRLDILVLL